MKKLKLNTNELQGSALNRSELKKVLGGASGSGRLCGIKVNDEWYRVAGGRLEAEGALGKKGSWDNGELIGTVTSWCCDSCYWNI